MGAEERPTVPKDNGLESRLGIDHAMPSGSVGADRCGWQVRVGQLGLASDNAWMSWILLAFWDYRFLAQKRWIFDYSEVFLSTSSTIDNLTGHTPDQIWLRASFSRA